MKTRFAPLLVALLLGASATFCSAAQRLNKEELRHEIRLDKRDTLLAEIGTLENSISRAASASDAKVAEKRKVDETTLKAKKLELAELETSLTAEQSAAAAAKPGATADQKQTARVEAIVAEIARASAESAAGSAEDGVDAKLRQNGVSLSVGGGVVGKGPDGGTIGTAVARWNILQARTTARHNVRADIKARGYSKVLNGAAPGLVMKPVQPIEEMEDKVPFVTAFGPFIGRAIQGDTIVIGTKRQRPWLLGASIGLGTYDQASSLFYIEGGYAISPTQGFSNAKGFIGLSFDALVFGKITGLTKPAVNSSGR